MVTGDDAQMKGGEVVQEKKKSPLKAISLMMIITLAGKVLGLVRDRLLTVNYGSGMEANAFLTASRIPRVFFDTIFASAISASFIPVFSEVLQKKGKKDAFRFAGNFISIMTAVCALITLLGVIFAEQLTYFFADGYDEATAELCAFLTRIMMPTAVFTGIAFSFVGVLQSLDEFNVPAAISLVSNCGVIVYYLTLNERFGVTGLAVAFLISWFLQAAVQIPALRKKGFTFTLSLSAGSEEMKKVFRLMLPVMVSTWVLPINQMIHSKFGSRLFDGSGVSAVELAYSLFTVIAGVFVLSVTNYIFPKLSRQNADNDAEGFKKTISASMHSCMYIVLPMTAGMFVMARPIVDFIYGGGEFDAFSVDITARALRFMSLGMVGYAAQAILSRVFFAEKNGKTPLLAGMGAIVVSVALCVLLTDVLDVAGIAIASSISFIVNGIFLAIPLQRRGMGFADRKFAADMVKMTLSALIMGGAVWGISLLLDSAGKLIQLAVPVAAGVAIYGVCTFVLRLPETELVRGFVKKVIERRKAGNA